MLSPKGQVPETATELDLLARIYAYQERFEDAARYWEAALKKDPGNSNYKNCLEQLSDIQAGKSLPDGERNTAIRVGIGACVILLIIGLLYWSQRVATVPVKVTLIEEKPAQPTPNTQSTTAVSQAATITEAATKNQRSEEILDQIQQTQKDQNQSLVSQIATIQTNQTVLLDGQTAARSQIAVLGESIVELKKQQAETQNATELIRSELATLTAARPSALITAEIASARLPNSYGLQPRNTRSQRYTSKQPLGSFALIPDYSTVMSISRSVPKRGLNLLPKHSFKLKPNSIFASLASQKTNLLHGLGQALKPMRNSAF